MPRRPGKKDTYVRMADRAEKGEYQLIDPLDYLFLDKLIDEGTMMGGYYPIGTTAGNLKKEHFPILSSEQVSSRLRVLSAQGLAVQVNVVGGRAWQRTTKGKEILETWQRTQSEK